MIKKHLALTAVILMFLFGSASSLKPPAAEKIKKELTFHGRTRIDNYYWLQERENPKVLEYLKAENNYTGAVMKETGMAVLQEKLFREITARIQQEDMSVPYKWNGYYYYRRFETGKEYAVYCREKDSAAGENKPAPARKEEILLDVNEMAEGFTYYHMAGIYMGPGNNLAAFGVDTVGRRKYTLHFKNLAAGKILDDAIPNTTGEVAWTDDNQTVFYALKDDALRPYKIMKHRLGKPTAEDAEIFYETDNTFNLSVFNSRSKKYVFIASRSSLSTEYRFLEATQPDGVFSIIQPREKDLDYSVDHFNDKFYIRTNWKAKNFRLMETPVLKTAKENWTGAAPYREDILLEEFTVFKNFLVLKERIDGLLRLKIIKWENREGHYLDFQEETYTADFGYNPEIETDMLRFTYNSLTTPYSTFQYDMNTRTRKLLKQEAVLGKYRPADYHTERRYAVVRDGTRVPISLVYRKGLAMNGDNPLLLEGYGAYGLSFDPGFSPARPSLLDRGFVYAIAHIRGGQEMGRDWYENGKLLKKKNTFTDFIDCAQYLVKEKFTNPDKLFALGGSAGGLLMGAVANMGPGLFKGIIAEVPWLDVVTCMLDESIPLVTEEFDEWGNPKNIEYYDYQLSYSPYDNIGAREYPAMLVTTGLHDSQVQYWDPAKYVAKLREKKTDNNILLFSIDMYAGHSGASGRFRGYEEIAREYAFMLHLVGIKE
ncbi:MAG: S9 family peptidase [Candidatus Aminicenantes bacterium]|nr:S9 family peptidase [Candidatus Aminicenantes bacterium]